MLRENLIDLLALRAVAQDRSFTKAAAKLGFSQSTLSHTIRELEARLGVRLLTRTTRSVAPTEAGERLLLSIGPDLDHIEGELAALSDFRDRPAGTIRITCSEHPADAILRPALQKILPVYPDIRVEVILDNGLTNIVAERYDAGIRLGEQVDKDMIAVRVSPEVSMALVGSPAYFENCERPLTPRDLVGHNCINLRLPTFGGLYAWEFEKDGQALNVRVDGQLTFNAGSQSLKAAIAGLGLAFVTADMAVSAMSEGSLIRVLEDWCPPFPGYHLYYPSRRLPSPAFAVLLEALRYRS
ncbi:MULTISPECIES: LysR family transcriptional regulator [unclassified Rhizobium]|uniref:LysR family transcriptional regulator n=1 Tax=unclassified Rhizobium TaxID=2613769 RepID=UPI001ADAAB91|nr:MULTISPECIES: LysR family transcriptional regulator [unclassified Rhizobium]MBO9097599.1 LysR family transcriptional regulator [Rhizobium sp. L58/93]MBO9182683.1 LysR family transcriptional regulator [Rhizobium sp. E27B/91]QXZ86460.1 LysR family transcriptional regulator [Rhizobium sp. K1/93]QXZ92085.1 LysR family transcriptional regulator [Rhizobium sp. K15/93]